MKEFYYINVEYENDYNVAKDYLISVDELKNLGNEIKKIEIIRSRIFFNSKKIKYYAVILNRKFIKQIFYNLKFKEDREKIPIHFSPCNSTEEVLNNYTFYYQIKKEKKNKVLKYAKKK